ncbi:MAG: TlpA family protein disulfide reductase [Proteobacteria bacterium]|nr:TlpA family protein disulfide reductase [Pseudomonadota bacterium]
MLLVRKRISLLVLMAAMALGLPLGASHAAALDLSAYKGKVVYLDFWASWCTPCRESFPWMSDIQRNYGSDGLVVIAVNVDRDRESADEFLQSFSPAFKVVYDPSGTIAKQYELKDMPTSVLIGRDGRVRFVHNGFYPDREDSYVGHIWTLLREGAAQ